MKEYENNRLENAEIYKEDGRFYTKLIYIHENDEGKYRLTFPKVEFPFPNRNISITGVNSASYLKLPTDECRIFGNSGELFTIEQIEQYPKEMTLEEIEKKLGHKVKIISK